MHAAPIQREKLCYMEMQITAKLEMKEHNNILANGWLNMD